MQTVAGLARMPMPDPIGQHNKEARRIESLTGPKELAGKLRPDEIPPIARGAVENEDRVRDHSVAIASGLAEGAVVDS